jgi:hypothetical protein
MGAGCTISIAIKMTAITQLNQMITGQKLELEDNQRNSFRRVSCISNVWNNTNVITDGRFTLYESL